MYKSISYNDLNFKNDLLNNFKYDGFVVINDVFDDNYCDYCVDKIIDDFIKMNPSIGTIS
jgi:hypothetical protein